MYSVQSYPNLCSEPCVLMTAFKQIPYCKLLLNLLHAAAAAAAAAACPAGATRMRQDAPHCLADDGGQHNSDG
jgi:hypothetical protein